MDQEDMIKGIEEPQAQEPVQQPVEQPIPEQVQTQPVQEQPINQPKKLDLMKLFTTISYIILAIATLFIAIGLWIAR